MLIGVISDTHDHLDNIITAIEIFKEKRVELIIHLGDIVSPFCLDFFNNSGIEWMGIFGNNDGEIEILLKKSGGRLTKEPREEVVSGKLILMVHTAYSFVDNLAKIDYYDVILYGHTHRPVIKKIGKTLVVNPGEACGLLTKKATAAIVDLEKLEAELVEL
ncbi:MAG: metallophosphoesterase [Thermosulfidibacteraceae bacterium]|jgi:putative phosphoesterase